ncbi:hypothetical protein [Rosistilla oblonga]|uniref:Uncharacterized protein n=1 Tax=Rosistilla oblonga TaxID=2527990 RepID=A0A518IQX7_9BACT|nr:hypothetical protein [Rosistilla oblonga]QDV55470.1 hypothetical protein Mal33_14440 [Rosistilla oblonga]
MAQNIDFLEPRLVGDRFNGHSIPLEVLKDLSALEELLVEVAKWHYRNENPERKRIPKGFADDVSLKVTEIGDGSAIPKIVLCVSSATGTLFPVDHREYFAKAKESVVTAIDNAHHQRSVAGILLDSHLAYFDRIGRSLRDNEALELNYPDTKRPAQINRTTRRYLTLAASSAGGFTEEVTLRGSVCEADQRKDRFQLRLIDGRIIGAPIQSEHRETILDAFHRFRHGVRVIIDGVGRYNRRNRLDGLESVEHISLLDPLDVGARLEEFTSLSNGWLEGRGIAPKADDLDWLTDQFEANYSDRLPAPYLYPTGEGGVQAEWSLDQWEATLDIDLKSKSAYWHALNQSNDEESEHEIDLSSLDGWKWLADQLTQLVPGDSDA